MLVVGGGGFVAGGSGILLPKLALAAVDPELWGTAVKELPGGALESAVLEAL